MKKRLLKILPVISIIFLVFSCFVFYFLYKEVSVNKKEFEENEIKWQQEFEKREAIKLQNDSIKKIEDENNALEKHFAESSNIVPFLDTIESFGTKLDVNTEVTLVEIPKDSDGLVVGINVSGSFENIYRFLLLLENSQYELETITFDIEKQEVSKEDLKNKKNFKWQASFKMKLLSFTK